MIVRLFVALTVFSLAGVALAQLQFQSQSQTQPLLVFRVTGESQAFPEIAVLKFTIVGEGETLGKAQEHLQQIEQAVFKTLEKFGIQKGQISAERFAVIPLQPSISSGVPSPVPLQPLGYRVQRGYEVNDDRQC